VTIKRPECGHVCLAGTAVSDDARLLRALRGRYAVTVATSVDFLARTELLATTTVLVLDGTGLGGAVLERLREVKDRYPELRVVLVDGGLKQLQVAEAFRLGARDYFAEPYDADLLIERIGALCIDERSGSLAGQRDAAG